MDFNQFFFKLNIVEEEVKMDDILFEVVYEFKEEMFIMDMVLYVEMMGDNYYIEEIVGVVWGIEKKIYVMNDLFVFEN